MNINHTFPSSSPPSVGVAFSCPSLNTFSSTLSTNWEAKSSTIANGEREGGREGGRKRGREGEREGGRNGRKEGGIEGGRQREEGGR